MEPPQGLRLPHIGFNRLDFRPGEPLFDELGLNKDFYFVHSYHFEAEDPRDVIGTFDYGVNFTGAVRRGNVWGVQFHPEKSQANGLRVLANFARMGAMQESATC